MKAGVFVAAIFQCLGVCQFAHAQVGVISADDAGQSTYSGGWSAGQNGGYGFGAWQFDNANSGNWGWFTGNSGGNGNGSSGNINSSNSKAWGMFDNNSTGTVAAHRTINSMTSTDTLATSQLVVGETLRLDMDNGFIDSTKSVGFSIRNANNQNLFEFFFKGGSSPGDYTVNSNDGQNLQTGAGGVNGSGAVGFTTDGLVTEFTLTGTTTFTFKVYNTSGTLLDTVSGNLLNPSNGQTVADIRAFNGDAGSGASDDAFYNNLKVKLPTWVGTSSGNFSTNTNWSGASRGGGPINGGSIAFDGGSGAITATNDSLTSVYNISFDKTAAAVNSGGTATTNATSYTLAGNALTINGGIDNNSTNLQTVNLNLTLGAAQTFAGGSNGLQFGSAVGAGNGAINNNGFLLTTSGTNTFNGVISGNGGLTVSGSTTLNGANSYSGLTTINSGTLQAAAAHALGSTSGITVNSGGTLLLSNSGTTDHINDSATMTLNGGTFNTGGVSEHGSVGIGALTLQNSSTIDFFNNGATQSIINFANSSGASWVASKILTISDWTGSQSGAGSDQLIFGSDATGLNASQIAEIQFLNPGGFSAGTYGAMILSTGEIVPVPEPGTWAAAALVLAALLGTQRRRLLQLARASRR